MILKKIINSPIIIALDYANLKNTLSFVDQIDPHKCRLKIGKKMFTLFGPSLVKCLQQRGFEIFLDLKFHDIPYTTAHAVAAAAELGVWMVNIHAMGGSRMLNAASEALIPFGKDAPLLIAVTILTSMNLIDLKELGIKYHSLNELAEKLAILTYNCGINGVVCSAHEASNFKQIINSNFILVTPGIRLIGSILDDQRRIMTPKQAKQVGVDYMVIGRPITQSSTPIMVLNSILQSLQV